MRHGTTEGWFLDRGLPSALTPRARARHLLARSAPALAAYATVVVALLVVYFLTGTSEIYIDGAPTRAEQIVLAVIVLVVVLAAAQLSHLMMVAVSTAAIYFALGLIVLSPQLLAKWTGNGAADGTVLGMTIPVPQSLIHMTLILCVLTFMYVSARSVGDGEYKADFLDPLIEDLHVTLVARNRYRAELADSG